MNPLSAIAALAPPDAVIPRRFTDFCEFVGLRLTQGQRALSRVAFDGENPTTDLERDIFGDATKIPNAARSTMALRLGRGSAKSTLCAAYGVFRMLTGDVSTCAHGDEPAVAVISAGMDQSRLLLKKAISFVHDTPILERMLVVEKADMFSLRRGDGIKVAFVTKAKSSGGKAGRGYSFLLLIVDEAEFIDPARPDSAINTDDIVDAVRPRIMSGGATILCSTPWPVESLVSKLFAANYGKPTFALAALASTLVMRDNNPQLAAARDEAMAIDSNKALREFDCILTDAEGTFFEASNIDRAVGSPRSRRNQSSSGIDLAFVSDSAAHVVVERQDSKVAIVHLDIESPTKQKPLVPSEVCERFVDDARTFGCTSLVSDGHYIETTREHAQRAGIEVVRAPTSARDILAAFLHLRELFRAGSVEIPNDVRLVAQLKSVMSVPQPGGGLKIILPRRRGAGHADLVSALVHAVWHDRRHGSILRGPNRVLDFPTALASGWER